MKIKTRLSKEQIIKELDRMNKDKLKYVGVLYCETGNRSEVTYSREIINDLNAQPIRKIKIEQILPPRLKELQTKFLILNISSAYVNIYKFDDVKDKLKGISKQKCLVHLPLSYAELIKEVKK